MATLSRDLAAALADNGLDGVIDFVGNFSAQIGRQIVEAGACQHHVEHIFGLNCLQQIARHVRIVAQDRVDRLDENIDSMLLHK